MNILRIKSLLMYEDNDEIDIHTDIKCTFLSDQFIFHLVTLSHRLFTYIFRSSRRDFHVRREINWKKLNDIINQFSLNFFYRAKHHADFVSFSYFKMKYKKLIESLVRRWMESYWKNEIQNRGKPRKSKKIFFLLNNLLSGRLQHF